MVVRGKLMPSKNLRAKGGFGMTTKGKTIQLVMAVLLT